MSGSERHKHVDYLTVEYTKSLRAITGPAAASISKLLRDPKMIREGMVRVEHFMYRTSKSYFTYFAKMKEVLDTLEEKKNPFSIMANKKGDLTMYYERELHKVLKEPVLPKVEKKEVEGGKKEKPIKIEGQ